MKAPDVAQALVPALVPAVETRLGAVSGCPPDPGPGWAFDAAASRLPVCGPVPGVSTQFPYQSAAQRVTGIAMPQLAAP